MPTSIPANPRVYRITHIDNLDTLLRRGGLHAPNYVPPDGLPYRPIHRQDIQEARVARSVKVGPGGVLLDYIPFFFGRRPPMLLQLHTGQVKGYEEGQGPLVYLVSRVHRIVASGCRFVFTDGHALARFTHWFDELADLAAVDWDAVQASHWADTPDDNDRQRRKQAEFLVHKFLPWDLVDGIAVYGEEVRERVRKMVAVHQDRHRPQVKVVRSWYYD